MTDIVWEEPPIAANGRGAKGKWLPFLSALRQRPGEWALFPGTKTTAWNICAGRIEGASRGEFENTTRKFGANTKIYMRCVVK